MPTVPQLELQRAVPRARAQQIFLCFPGSGLVQPKPGDAQSCARSLFPPRAWEGTLGRVTGDTGTRTELLGQQGWEELSTSTAPLPRTGHTGAPRLFLAQQIPLP